MKSWGLSFLTVSKTSHHSRFRPAFTIVELIVVIVVIGILATISITSYNGVQRKAQISKINSDLKMFSKVIQLARLNNSKTFGQISGSYYSAGSCYPLATGTDIAALSRSDGCWVRYIFLLNSISNASGVSITNLVDPWGRPYSIDENEGEAGRCGKDSIGTFSYPFVTNTSYSGSKTEILPLSGFTGCS